MQHHRAGEHLEGGTPLSNTSISHPAEHRCNILQREILTVDSDECCGNAMDNVTTLGSQLSQEHLKIYLHQWRTDDNVVPRVEETSHKAHKFATNLNLASGHWQQQSQIKPYVACLALPGNAASRIITGSCNATLGTSSGNIGAQSHQRPQKHVLNHFTIQSGALFNQISTGTGCETYKRCNINCCANS